VNSGYRGLLGNAEFSEVKGPHGWSLLGGGWFNGAPGRLESQGTGLVFGLALRDACTSKPWGLCRKVG